MPTLAHRSIRHCLAMLAPAEGLTPGQQALHTCITGLYRAMLADPEGCLIFPQPYETYIARRKAPDRPHASDTRESTLRNAIQQAIQFYATYLYHLGQACDNAHTLDADQHAAIVAHMARRHGAEHNPARYALLARHGFSLREQGGRMTLTHIAPGLVEALVQLCRAPEDPYHWMNYLRLDFRRLDGTAPGVADICRTLPQASADIIVALEQRLSPLGCKAKVKPLRGIVSDFQWKVEYRRKGQNICGFYADNVRLTLCLYFNDFRNITAFADRLLSEEPALFAWFQAQFPERLCRCRSNRRVRFGSEERRICGLSNRAEVPSPTQEDVTCALRVLQLYRDI